MKATTSTATVKQRTCKNPDCKKRFRPTVKTAIYCNRTCKDKSANKKVKKDPMEKALKTAFFYYLARECLRAGTLEILRGHTVESLSDLYTLYKSNMQHNGYGDRNEYELSHIAPVKGHDFIGLLYAENLVSAPKALNRAHSTKYYGYGKSIHRPLDSKWNVDKELEKESDVVARVIDYLGKKVVLDTIKNCKIKPAQRSQLTEWIVSRYDPANPDHVAALPSLSKLDDLKTKELQHVKAAMLGEEDGEYFASPASRPEVVLCHELTRLSAYRPELEVFAYALSEALATQTESSSLFTLHHAQMLFDVLHGKSIAVMADTLEMVIAENIQLFMLNYAPGKRHVIANPETQRYFLQDHKDQVVITSLAAFKASMGQPARTVVLVDTVDSLSLVRPRAVDMNSSDPFCNAPF